jgi:NADPH-dependent glutamate synthase beta subunit-like oxidoreductase
MLGHDVTFFDEGGELGGMLRFAIPEYRLPKTVLRRERSLPARGGAVSPDTRQQSAARLHITAPDAE